jgi:hypothetical protein
LKQTDVSDTLQDGAVVQAVSNQLFTAVALVRAQLFHVGFVVDKMALG